MVNIRKKFILPVAAVSIFTLIFILLIIYSALTYEKINVSTSLRIEEEPLTKNTILNLEIGEKYVYLLGEEKMSYEIFDEEFNLTCIKEIKKNEIQNVICINEEGLFLNNLGSNATYGIPFLLFKPWMLALDENWTWKNTLVVSYETELDIEPSKIDVFYEYLGEEKIFGRDIYKIKMTIEDISETYWIDKEKRILIKKEGVENVLLIEAPFELNS